MANSKYTLMIRNAYLRESNEGCDIAISGDRIAEISRNHPGKGEKEIDAGGKFVSPAFIDSHTHMDKSFTGSGARQPKYYEAPYARDRSIQIGLEYYRHAPVEEIQRHVIQHALLQIKNGTLYTRTHVDVDQVVRTKAVEAVIAARKELRGLIDIQIVAFAQSGFLRDSQAEPLVRRAIEMGADLVGGLDPATWEHDIEIALEVTFRIARDFDIPIDEHMMERGTLGIYALQRLAAKIIENQYMERVTSSHNFSLADAPSEGIDQSIPLFKDAGLKLVTCYSSSPPAFPFKKLLEANIPIGCGSDNIKDFWIPFGSGDMVQGAFIETQRWNLRTNADLESMWDMITVEGAKVLGMEEDYGIAAGKKADLVILDALSPQWAIIDQARKLYVVKNGRILVENGDLLPELREKLSE